MTPRSPRAVVLGGTGAVGTSTALRLAAAGWSVTVTGRSPTGVAPDLVARGVSVVLADRNDETALGRVMGDGADLVVDCACYTAAQARALVPFLSDAGSALMLSTKAVYVDAAGLHTNAPCSPRFPVPITEAQPTVRPSDQPFDSPEGYGANKVAAEEVLLDSGRPVTVLRLSKVHGAWSRRPREWVFAKRALERRAAVFLAHRGSGVDHPSAAANVAALVEAVAARPGRRVLNAADPDAPNALAISSVVARWAGHRWEEVLLDGAPPDGLGANPWDTVAPIVLDTSAAVALGYRPAGDYAATVVEELDWLAGLWRAGDPLRLLPQPGDGFFGPLLDYAAEDAFLARSGRPSGSGRP